MIKRFLSVALIVGLLFSMGAAAFAVDTVVIDQRATSVGLKDNTTIPGGVRYRPYGGDDGVTLTFSAAGEKHNYYPASGTEGQAGYTPASDDGWATDSDFTTYFFVGATANGAPSEKITVSGLTVSVDAGAKGTGTPVNEGTVKITGDPTISVANNGQANITFYVFAAISSKDVTHFISTPVSIPVYGWSNDIAVSFDIVKKDGEGAVNGTFIPGTTKITYPLADPLESEGTNSQQIDFGIANGLTELNEGKMQDKIWWSITADTADFIKYFGDKAEFNGAIASTDNAWKFTSGITETDGVVTIDSEKTPAYPMSLKLHPSTIGSFKFTVKAMDTLASWDSKVEVSATKEITVTISGDTPVVTLSADAGTDVAVEDSYGAGLDKAGNGEINVSNVDLGKIYDSTNGVFYTGKNVARSKDLTGSADIVFIIRGSSQDLKVTASGTGVSMNSSTGIITLGNSGLYLSPDADVALTGTTNTGAYDADAGDSAASKIIRGAEKKYFLRGTPTTAGFYNLTLGASNAAGNATSKVYTFNVAAAPVITTETPNEVEVVWGKATTILFKGSNVDSWDLAISKDEAGKILDDSGTLLNETAVDDGSYILGVKGIIGEGAEAGQYGIASLDKETSGGPVFTHTGTRAGLTFTWTAGKNETELVNFPDGKTEFTRKLRLLAYRGNGEGAAIASKDITLKFKMTAPAMDFTSATATNAFKAKNITWGEVFGVDDFSSTSNVVLSAKGPGEIAWTVENLPAGITYMVSQDENKYKSYIAFSGDPQVTTASNHTVKITAGNLAGSSDISPTVVVGYTGAIRVYEYSEDIIARSTAAGNSDKFLLSGDKAVNDDFISYVISAEPGPITWTYENLPAGITLSAEPDGNTARFVGTNFTTATTKDTKTKKFNSRYTIKATNVHINKSNTDLSNDVIVYATPIITTATLGDLTTHKDYKVAIAATGYPKSWDISINGVDGDFNANGKSYISLDVVSYSNDCSETVYIVGSLDRVPTGGTFYVQATAWNPAGYTNAAMYNVKVNGVAPKVANSSVVLKKEANSSVDVAVTGDLPITLTAMIEGGKAKTIFGDDYADGIDLSTWDNPTGILFSPDFDVSGDLGTGKLILSTDTAYAYTDLPITITAVNQIMKDIDSNGKSHTATGTYKLSISGADPAWYVWSNDASGAATSIDVTSAGTIEKAFATEKPLKNPYISATDQDLYFFASADKPIQYDVKPESDKGISITLDESTGVVTITGTPEESNKDAKIKVTLTAKNPSTKKTAKLIYNITARPVPEFDPDEVISKDTLLGKKLSLKPKMKATTKDIRFYVSSDDATLLTKYGLTVDAKKGSITGTTAATTTANDDEVTYEMKKVTLYAANEVGENSKDVNFGIKGAKPKLTTKKFTDLEVGTEVKKTIETNLGTAVTSRMSFVTDDFTGALAGFVVSEPNNDGTSGAIITGTPSAAVKKHNVTFTISNVGTVATGKIAFTVSDPKPDPKATTDSIALGLNESETVGLSLATAPTGDTAINWKIKTKPTGGVKATLKKNGNEATLTIKSPKKATADITTSVVVTATNKVTKEVGEVPIAITVNAGSTESTSKPEEVLDTTTTEEVVADETEAPAETPETTEETAEAEAILTLGAERSEASLTAGQRAEIEEAGYVIAAILPEVTVNKSGQYDLEVTLDEAAPAGAELKWFAFPADGVKDEDDEIVDFYDAEGEETSVVPEDHVVTVVPWFRADVTYSPVIAVKIENADGAKETVEDAASGDVVTEEALEEAAAAPETETEAE